MNSQNYSTSFSVEQSPAEVFAAITNIRAWWTGEIEGSSAALGDEFSYRQKEIHYSKQRVSEFVPNKRLVWQVVEAQLNFTEDKSEWVGTEIRFEISEKGGKTEVQFSHIGLAPELECFEACSNAWGYYINGSLRTFIQSKKTQEA